MSANAPAPDQTCLDCVGCPPPRCAPNNCSWKLVNNLVQNLCEAVTRYHNAFVLSGANAATSETLLRDLKGCPDQFDSCDTSPASLQKRLYEYALGLLTQRGKPGLDVNIYGLVANGCIQPLPAWTAGADNISNVIVNIACFVTYLCCKLTDHIQECDIKTGNTKVCLTYEVSGHVKTRSALHFLDGDDTGCECGEESCEHRKERGDCGGCADGPDELKPFVVPVTITAIVSGNRIVRSSVYVDHGSIIRQTGCVLPSARVFTSVSVNKGAFVRSGCCSSFDGCGGGGCPN